MSGMKEIQQIRVILSYYKKLGISSLIEEENALARKQDELVKEIEGKLQIIGIIDEEIEELEAELGPNEILEFLDVEAIRSKNQWKRSRKKLRKLESMDTSRFIVDITDNDKVRFRKHLSRLSLMKRLFDLTLDLEGRVLLSECNGMSKIFKTNKNTKTKANRKVAWDKIKESSLYIDKWAELFPKK